MTLHDSKFRTLLCFIKSFRACLNFISVNDKIYQTNLINHETILEVAQIPASCLA